MKTALNVHYAKRIWDFFECRHTKQFWKEFQYYYYTLTREFICLTLQDVITGILYTNCPLLNYLILIAKLYLWGCRRNQTLPVITAFSSTVKIKYETEKYKCVKTNKMDKLKLNKNWALPLDSVPECRLYLERIFLFFFCIVTLPLKFVVQCNVMYL